MALLQCPIVGDPFGIQYDSKYCVPIVYAFYIIWRLPRHVHHMKNVTCPAHYPRTLGHRTQLETRSTNDEPTCTLALPFRWTVMKWTYRDADIYDDGIDVTTIIICLPQSHYHRRHSNPFKDSVKLRLMAENKENEEKNKTTFNVSYKL